MADGAGSAFQQIRPDWMKAGQDADGML